MNHAGEALLVAVALVAASAGCTRSAAEGPARDPLDGYAVVEHPPLRIHAEGTAAEVEATFATTLGPALASLRTDLFVAEPADGLQLWLFADDEARERLAPEVVAHHDPDRDGYYSVADHTVVATLSAGETAPLHYLVHAYVRADLPGCPVWYDEGLGTLLGASELRGDHLVGLSDGRPSGLGVALQEGTAPPLAALLAMDGPTFHGPGAALHVAMARSLCQHLQELDLLRSFHHQLRAALPADPDGSRTLLAVHGARDLEALEQRWRGWVLALPGED